jgi:N6-L-threonylcarbamoyladenine synthase
VSAHGPILGIETSCDETAAAVVSPDGRILSNIIFSQTVHTAYGGVVPELASREHAGRLPSVVGQALEKANVDWSDLRGIAVTAGPGLVGCLLVGVAYSRAAARAREIALYAVNHLEGHAHTPAMEAPDIEYPYLVLIASGGHSSLVIVEQPGHFREIGRTRDDAAGEALDKVGKLMGLDYPAGPQLDRIGHSGRADTITFPRARFDGQGYDFSFSGVKTAAAQDWNDRRAGRKPEVNLSDWAASFELAVMDALCDKLFRAAIDLKIKTISVAGGVARNRRLRIMIEDWAKREGLRAVIPRGEWCADNAAMIAAVGLYQQACDNPSVVDAIPNWGLGKTYTTGSDK